MSSFRHNPYGFQICNHFDVDQRDSLWGHHKWLFYGERSSRHPYYGVRNDYMLLMIFDYMAEKIQH